MSNSIQTNIASLEAQNFIRINNNFQNNTIEQLSSGLPHQLFRRRRGRSRNRQSICRHGRHADAGRTQCEQRHQHSAGRRWRHQQHFHHSESPADARDGIGVHHLRRQSHHRERRISGAAGGSQSPGGEYQSEHRRLEQYESCHIRRRRQQSTNSQVSVDLSGAYNAVDSTALGIANTNVAGGGTELTGNIVNLNNTATTFVSGNALGTQTFNFNIATATGNTAYRRGGDMAVWPASPAPTR